MACSLAGVSDVPGVAGCAVHPGVSKGYKRLNMAGVAGVPRRSRHAAMIYKVYKRLNRAGVPRRPRRVEILGWQKVGKRVNFWHWQIARSARCGQVPD